MKLVHVIVCIFVASIFLQAVFCRECLQLETGDVSGFDTRKFTGRYQLVMGIMDGPVTDLKLNCNGVSIIQHLHPRGGVNVAMSFEDTDGKVLDTVLPHFDSPTDITAIELDSYDQYLKKWIDFYFKILLATDDLLVISSCVNNEDDKEDKEFFVSVLRKEGSNLPVADVRDLLPDSVKSKPELLTVCDK